MFHLSQVFGLLNDAIQDGFSLIPKEDLPAPEKYIHPNLMTFLKEIPDIPEFELNIVFIGLGSQANLLEFGACGFLLEFPFFFLFFIDEPVEIQDPADWRICIGSNFHKVQPFLPGDPKRFLQWINSGLRDILPDKPNFPRTNFFIDTIAIADVFVC